MKQTQEGTVVPQEKCPIRQKRGKRTRTAGHTYERDCAEELRQIGFPHVVTSRAESKGRDDQKIDLMNKDELKNGRLPYNVQCKSSCQPVAYTQLLVPRTVIKVDKRTGKQKKVTIGMPKVEGVVNVIFHNFTDNKGINNTVGRFVSKGEFAILEKADFLAMVQELELFKIWKERNAKQLATSKIRKGEYPCTPDESFKVES